MAKAQRTTLVTGGTGFLGETLVRALLRRGIRVRIFSRTEPADLVAEGAEWRKGTVLDKRGLERAADGVDTIFHLAGQVLHSRREGYAALRELHVTGTANAVEAAYAAGARVIAASTSGTVAVQDAPDDPATDTSPYATALVRRWPYYLTKVEAEHALFDRGAALDVPVVAMRPSLLLGPGDARSSSTRIVADYLERKIPIVPSGGLNCVDVRDVADAFVAAMEHPSPSPSYLLGAVNLRFSDLFAALERLSGVPRPKLRVPYALIRSAAAALGPLMPADPVEIEMTRRYWYLDAAGARTDLDFAPRPLDETLADTIAWCRR